MEKTDGSPMAPMIVYTLLGAAVGALGGFLMERAGPMVTAGALDAARVARLVGVGALLGSAGAMVDRSGKKLVTGALAGALGLVASFLLIERMLQMGLDMRPMVAVTLGVAASYGALVILIYGLLEPDFRGISYAVILGAIGGLAGVAASFAVCVLGRLDRFAVLVFFSLYAALLWTCGALSRKLERAENET